MKNIIVHFINTVLLLGVCLSFVACGGGGDGTAEGGGDGI